MRRTVRIALWVLLLGGSAATGAFIAAHSNPLPPQVAAEPSSPTPVETTTPPKTDQWVGTIRSASFHRLYVGGTCQTNWVATLSFSVLPDGTISGGGAARLTTKDTPCPFPVVQIQIRRFRLDLSGRLAAGKLEIRLRDAGHVPASGSDDLGGFQATTLSMDLRLAVRHAGARRRLVLQASDQDRGTFGSVNLIRLRCTTC
jgi:hypothetical protein